MKLITLNVWGGRITEPLYEFLRKNSGEIDIFCLQEIYNNAPDPMTDNERDPILTLFSDIQELLLGYDAYFRAVIGEVYGIGIFIKKEIEVSEEGDMLIHHNPYYTGRGGNHSRNLQWAKFAKNTKEYAMVNIHGLWNGQGKSDSEDRLNQSKKILEFIKTLSHDFVLCGDFNLLPETESIRMIEESGLRNLIKEFNITSTRTSFYEKPLKFADYIFTSKGIKVKDFKVLQDEVSDHSPLYLEFE
jgi:endonuclease/exonuclease/phosphatase family metal-dependent hydrolase